MGGCYGWFGAVGWALVLCLCLCSGGRGLEGRRYGGSVVLLCSICCVRYSGHWGGEEDEEEDCEECEWEGDGD